MNTYTRGWRECQQEEKERIEIMRQKKREFRNWSEESGDTAMLIIVLVAIAALLLFVGVRLHEYASAPAPVADVYQVRV